MQESPLNRHGLFHSYYIKTEEKNGPVNPVAGSISFLERFGSDLSLSPHHPILGPEGVNMGDKSVFKKAPSTTYKDMEKHLTEISLKTRNHLVKKGYLNADGEICLTLEIFSDFFENEAFAFRS